MENLKHEVLQAAIFGAHPADIASQFGLELEEVVKMLEHSAEFTAGERPNSALRKTIALARLDHLQAKLLEMTKSGNLEAMKTFVQVQKREAAITGMDSPTKQEAKVFVDIPWIKPGRLGYKDSAHLAEDIAHRIVTPQLPPPAEPSEKSADQSD